LRKTVVLNLEEILAIQNRVRGLRDAELVLLNGHLLVERVLVASVAARLRCKEYEVPKQMQFSMKARLAPCSEEERERILQFNKLRNALVHEFGALDTEVFSKGVNSFELPWPDGSLERAAVLELITWYILQIVLDRYVEELYRDELYLYGNDADHHTAIENWTHTLRTIVTAARPLAHEGKWYELVEAMKPGWRKS
jgi:hypothetical protein